MFMDDFTRCTNDNCKLPCLRRKEVNAEFSWISYSFFAPDHYGECEIQIVDEDSETEI